MDRELLFRGKRPDNGKWVEGGFVQSENSWIVTIEDPDGYFKHHLVYRSTVGQYTGLTDKNGVKIFEGDRVALINPKPFKNTTGVVQFVDGCFDVVFDREGFGRDYLKSLVCNWTCKVIGNIHDNPEWMGGKSNA